LLSHASGDPVRERGKTCAKRRLEDPQKTGEEMQVRSWDS